MKELKTCIQLYTLRDSVKSDLLGTLKALSEMGFNSLETYGFDGRFYSYSATEFKKICSDFGMDIISTHCNITAENAYEYAEQAALAGLEYLILPSFNGRAEKTMDDF